METQHSQRPSELLRSNPLSAELTVRFTIRDASVGNEGIDLETFPPTNPKLWNIDQLFKIGQIPKIPGTYVFFQSAIRGFKMLEYPQTHHVSSIRLLQICFARVMGAMVSELVDLFGRFPYQEVLEQIGDQIIQQMISSGIYIKQTPEKKLQMLPWRVVAKCPHCSALSHVIEGSALETLVFAGLESLQALLNNHGKIHWALQGEEIHVALEKHGQLFDGFVNGALAEVLQVIIDRKQQELLEQIEGLKTKS